MVSNIESVPLGDAKQMAALVDVSLRSEGTIRRVMEATDSMDDLTRAIEFADELSDVLRAHLGQRIHSFQMQDHDGHLLMMEEEEAEFHDIARGMELYRRFRSVMYEISDWDEERTESTG